jgi:hydrogenase maturation factor
MEFRSDKSRLLFLKYALPCAATLVKRGKVSAKLVKDSISDVSNGKIKGHPEVMFETANEMCETIAKRQSKKSIDEKVIRRYFLWEHDEAINRRFKRFKDFDPMACRVFPGRIANIKGSKAEVNTVIGKIKYRVDFIQKPVRGDYVVVHRNFAVERISKLEFNKLWKIKENYFKSTI